MNLEDLPNYGIALEKLKDVPVKALTSHETFENLREAYFPYVLKASPFTSSNDYSTYLLQCYRHHMSCYKLRLERHKYLYEPNMCEKSACAACRERESKLTYRNGSVARPNVDFSCIMHPDKNGFLILKSHHMVIKIHNLHIRIQVVSIK